MDESTLENRYRIAHEFNNLLAGIQGSVSLLLLDKPPDHRDVPYLKKIETLVEQASELTRRLAGSDPIPKYREEKDGLNDGIDTDAGILDRTPREACASDDAATEPGLAATAELTRKSILLVEDEEIVASIGEKMLSRLGYRVLVARNGNEAFQLYVQHRSEIELVILDMVMPGMAGGEIFDRLKSINPRIAVLLSSGYSLNGQTLEILRRGCRGFIQKPFNLEQLQQQISAILSGH
jgi:CheY-like chemotaxis protein